MGRTYIRQDEQIGSTAISNVSYDDTIAPTLAAYETNPVTIDEDLNNIRSMLSYLKDIQAGNWYDTQTAPSALEAGTLRGVDGLNDALHAVEKKRVLRCVWGLDAITIAGAGDTFDILGTGELPGNTTAALGAVTTLGTVVAAHGGTFGTHSLAEVAGSNAISPKNLVHIVDSTTRDPVLDGNDRIYGLLQAESGLSDGGTITDTTTTRVQISFVKVSGSDLVAISSGAMDGVTYDYCYVERVRLEDLNEADFLGNADVDVPASATVTRQVAYDNQGTTPVDLTTNATLDLEGAGLTWSIRDDLEASLISVVEGSAGGTSQFNIHADVDEFDVDAAVNNFLQGVSMDSGGTQIDVGVSAGVIETTGAANLTIYGAGELLLNDGNFNAEATWTQAGVKVTETQAEITTYESNFGGEVSLFNAINQAYAQSTARRKVVAVVTSAISADADASGPSNDNNLDADLGDLSAGTFTTDYDIYLNGVLLRNGANAAANHDVYPGTSLANGQLKFEFALKAGGNPDVITVIDWAA